MEMQSLKQTYYQDDTGLLEYELYEDMVIIHCTVSKWSPRILRNFYSVFKTFKEEVAKSGIYKIITLTPNPRFCELFCGVRVNSFTHEGIDYETILWDLKPLP